MGAGKANPPIQPPEPPASERLESWKEIANYLNRGVTTVQRWEKQEGLPVHRHPHEKRGTPYAFKPELDAWWQNGHARLEALEQQEEKKAPSRRLWLAAVATATLLAVATGVGVWRWRVRPPPLPFEERDWVLIASFENRTGEAVLDGTLEHALERELSNSRFVNVVPRERITDALRLMKKPPETKVDAALGREICLRDGGIRALLSGRVEKLDNTYVLSASLVEPSGGVTVAGFSQEAVGEKELVPAVRRLSSRLREALGENLSLIQQSAQELEKVTTPSLRALQLFSQADALIAQWKSDVAEQLLKQAVIEDPEFASGYMHLAHAIRNQGRPEEEYRPPAERAVELSEKVSERERYFILGSYYHMLGQSEKAITTYEALVRLYPDHYWGTNNLAFAYMKLGRPQEAARYRMRLADLRPNDLVSNWTAFQALVTGEGDLEKARPYLLRARKLAALPGRSLNYPVPWVRFTTADEYWQQGHMGKVFSEVTRFEQLARSGSGRGRDRWATAVGAAYLALGKLKLSEELFHTIADPNFGIWGLVQIATLRGDRQALIYLAERLKKLKSPGLVLRTICLLRAGLLSEAEAAISDMENNKASSFPEGLPKYFRGELALARRNTGQAIALFEEAVRPLGAFRFFAFGGSESLARAWEQQGNFQRAIGILEAVRPFRTRYLFPGSAKWMKTQLRLAQLYRKVGREQEAGEIEAELRKLLVYADPDHPFLRQLQRLQEAARAQPPS